MVQPARAPALPPQPKPSAKVVVGSKIPMAIEIQHCEIREVQRRLRETAWTDKEGAKVGPIIRINGTAYPRGQAPDGFRAPPQMVSGYALTHGVDREWFEAWLKQNKDAPFVANKLLIYGATRDEVAQKARDLTDLRSGLDPIVPPKEDDTPSSRDPRLPRPIKGIAVTGEAGPTDAD